MRAARMLLAAGVLAAGTAGAAAAADQVWLALSIAASDRSQAGEAAALRDGRRLGPVVSAGRVTATFGVGSSSPSKPENREKDAHVDRTARARTSTPAITVATRASVRMGGFTAPPSARGSPRWAWGRCR